MNTDQLTSQIKAYVNTAHISQANKDMVLSRLPASTPQQLEDVKTVMMRQVVMDIYLDELEKFVTSEYLLDEEDLDAMYNTVVTRLNETQQSVLTEAELSQVRASLENLHGNIGNSSTIPIPSAAAASSVVSIPPVTPPIMAVPTNSDAISNPVVSPPPVINPTTTIPTSSHVTPNADISAISTPSTVTSMPTTPVTPAGVIH